MMGFRTVQQRDRMFDRGRQPPDSDGAPLTFGRSDGSATVTSLVPKS